MSNATNALCCYAIYGQQSKAERFTALKYRAAVLPLCDMCQCVHFGKFRVSRVSIGVWQHCGQENISAYKYENISAKFVVVIVYTSF